MMKDMHDYGVYTDVVDIAFDEEELEDSGVTPLVLRARLAPRFRPKKNFRKQVSRIFLFKTYCYV